MDDVVTLDTTQWSYTEDPIFEDRKSDYSELEKKGIAMTNTATRLQTKLEHEIR